jgi:hypothetical protein
MSAHTSATFFIGKLAEARLQLGDKLGLMPTNQQKGNVDATLHSPSNITHDTSSVVVGSIPKVTKKQKKGSKAVKTETNKFDLKLLKQGQEAKANHNTHTLITIVYIHALKKYIHRI